jgi:histidinol phosphatase-like enzyme
MTRPAVFFDRDGALVEEVSYLHDPERLVLLPGVGELARLVDAGFALVVVTNQAGVARGFYDEAAVAAVHRRRAWPPSATWRPPSKGCFRAMKRPGPFRP